MENNGYIKRFMPIWTSWKLDKFLGCGSFGNVWQVISDDGEEAAIKEIIVPSDTVETLETACLQGLEPENAKQYFACALEKSVDEANMQQKLSDCRNIVKFRDYKIKTLDKPGEFGWALYILMDKVKDFTSYLLENGITLEKLIQLGIDLCCALERFQKENIIHRDIKPENIFYNHKLDCFQLGDFGIAQYLERPTISKGKPGTLTHMSPQVYSGSRYGYDDDLYAVGMILYKLMNYNRIPLLPDYPLAYMPDQRNEALISRLNGAKIPLPALTNLKPEQIDMANHIRAGVRFRGEWEISKMRRLGKITQKAIAADAEGRYGNAFELRKELEKL